MIHRALASINLKALQANFRVAKSYSQQGNTKTQIAAVIKANAYGHGLLPVAEALADEADLFAVTDTVEALALETSKPNKPILILQGIIDPDEIKLIAEHGFQLVIHSLEQLALIDERLSQLSIAKPLTFWLKLDSGMGRLGLNPKQYTHVFHDLSNKPYTQQVIMMTHLANSSLPHSKLNQHQLDTFTQYKNSLSEGAHVSTSIPSSAGLLSELNTQSDWSRPGLMLYGSSPFSYKEDSLRRENFGLQAVMTLESKIIAIQELSAGDSVGYCSQYICPKNMRVGVVSIGYADGYPSNAPNGIPVLVNGQRTSTIGRVSMDVIAVDLSELPQVQVNDVVTLWGEELSIDEVAHHTGILSYNLTCSISPRVRVTHG